MTVTTTPRPTGHPGYSETMPREPRSAAGARRLVRTALAAWGMEALTEDATLVITELVSNAAVHGRLASIRVLVTRPDDGRVRLGVVDRSRRAPVPRRDLDGEETRGRGMVLIDALSDRWGTEAYRWGKQVWAELALDADRREHRRG
ncbi:ATP-binding protein [Streptomyces sp. NBC_00102]|uniref:ATP-binding protein n=1 Tax=Streptomyces sp. NBC_00102 TaxID=2975652 RepID=UPI002251CBEB|nr:ATP-binding protein [Streptomyces sp. NBC_00102]MCX5399105.1 ATP-binding protein [Streptomyces sp. NBC_00102]